jgi:hypothetical protein
MDKIADTLFVTDWTDGKIMLLDAATGEFRKLLTSVVGGLEGFFVKADMIVAAGSDGSLRFYRLSAF